MNDISRRNRTNWKGITLLFGCLLLFVLLLWFPTDIQTVHANDRGHTAFNTIQSTPTVDPTVTALNKLKLQDDTNWFWNYGATLITSLVTTFALLAGGFFAIIRWYGDRRDQREKQVEEQKRRLQDRQAEREKQGEARFQAVVEGLGSNSQATQVGAAITLRTFLRPNYEQFYRQVFDLAVSHLRLRHFDPDKAEPLDSLSQALITIFKESFPLARQQLKDAQNMQQLDATQVQLESAFLAYADLRGIWLPQTHLRDANLYSTDLRSAVLFSSDLRSVHLSEADLTKAALFSSNLSKANLSKANLSGASLSNADLSKANLSGADLSGADLRGADLSGTNLSSANLSGADLSRANLSGTNLSGADLQNIKKWKRAVLINVKGLEMDELARLKSQGAITEETKKEPM